MRPSAISARGAKDVPVAAKCFVTGVVALGMFEGIVSITRSVFGGRGVCGELVFGGSAGKVSFGHSIRRRSAI